MPNSEIEFVSGQEILRGTLSLPQKGMQPTVLAMHGAGQSHSGTLAYLCDRLGERGLGAFRFDFSGHGQSSGTIGNSSLAKRLDEARSAARHIALDKYPILVGSSMGAHIASRLANELGAKALILFSPAAFAADAEELGFSHGFTEIIRRPFSYENSLVFSALDAFRGSCLFVTGSEDKVIPRRVLDLYHARCSSAKLKVWIEVRGAHHRLHDWFQTQPTMRELVLGQIMSFACTV